MTDSLHSLLSDLTPPFLWRGLRQLRSLVAGTVRDTGRLSRRRANGLSGDFATWDEAVAMSTGYDSELILEKTCAALLQVKRGEAAYERDSVLFDTIAYTWPVLAGLMWVASRAGGALNVLDFGGSLGSTYYQHQPFLSALSNVRWNIVEQPAYIQIGRNLFADKRLHFYENISDCVADTKPGVVLFSSVLQYLQNPYTILEEIFELPCDHLIIDRTPFWSGPSDRLCVQTVPPEIYSATYPSWVFSKQRFYASIPMGWQVIAEFVNADRLAAPVEVSYQGAIIARNTKVS